MTGIEVLVVLGLLYWWARKEGKIQFKYTDCPELVTEVVSKIKEQAGSYNSFGGWEEKERIESQLATELGREFSRLHFSKTTAKDFWATTWKHLKNESVSTKRLMQEVSFVLYRRYEEYGAWEVPPNPSEFLARKTLKGRDKDSILSAIFLLPFLPVLLFWVVLMWIFGFLSDLFTGKKA